MNNFDSYKVFSDHWQVIDDAPNTGRFFSVIKDDPQALIIRRSVMPFMDDLTWISDHAVDASVIASHAEKDLIYLSYATAENSGTAEIINLPDGYSITLDNSAVVYESENKVPFNVNARGCLVRRAVTDDMQHLKTARAGDELGDTDIDYASQLTDCIERGENVFVLEHNGGKVSFLTLDEFTLGKRNYRYLEPTMIYTVPSERERGFAGVLLRTVMNMNTGTPFLYSADSASNEASNSLAASCGFEIIGYNNAAIMKKQKS